MLLARQTRELAIRCVCVCELLSRVRLFETPWTVAAGLLCPWNSPGKNTGMGSHSFLQGIFPTQGSNPGFLHCRQILYHLTHQGSPLNRHLVCFSCWGRSEKVLEYGSTILLLIHTHGSKTPWVSCVCRWL